MTSAPWSPSIDVANGPEITAERSMMRIPASGPVAAADVAERGASVVSVIESPRICRPLDCTRPGPGL